MDPEWTITSSNRSVNKILSPLPNDNTPKVLSPRERAGTLSGSRLDSDSTAISRTRSGSKMTPRDRAGSFSPRTPRIGRTASTSMVGRSASINSPLMSPGRSMSIVSVNQTPKDRLRQAAETAAMTKLQASHHHSHSTHNVEGWRLKIRENCIDTGYLDRFVIFVIMGNSITLALEDPAPDASNPEALRYLDLAFTVFYTIEFILRIAGNGYWGTRTSYFGYNQKLKLRNGDLQSNIKISWWSVLDFTVVVSGIFSLIFLAFGVSSNAGPLSALRSFRLLRPLKAVSVLSEMRVLMKSILQSLPRLLNMLLLFMMFLFAMGIIAIQLWKGVLRNRCFTEKELFGNYSSPNINIPDDEIGRVCSNATGTLMGFHCSYGAVCVPDCTNPGDHGKTSFDNMGASLLTLTVAVTKEGWSNTMYHTIDGSNYFSSLYFVMLTFMGAYCIINLTVVIVNNVFDYNLFYEDEKKKLKERQRAKAEQGGDETALEYVQHLFEDDGGEDVPDAIEFSTNRDLTRLKKYQRGLMSVVSSSWYEYFMFSVILANIVVLSLWHDGTSLIDLLLVLNVCFTCFFVFDVVIKMLVFHVKMYFSSKWNIFDFIIALISIVHVCFENPWNHSEESSIKVLQVIRTLQVLRVLKLTAHFPRLRRWVRVFLESIQSAVTLTALLVLIIFIYALLGMQLFAGRFCGLDGDEDPLVAMPEWAAARQLPLPPADVESCPKHPRAHFDNVFAASLSLFQILSGEDWQLIMYNGMAASGDITSLYFVSWYFIGNSLLLNLFISILISRVTQVRWEDVAIQAVASEWRKEKQRGGGKLSLEDTKPTLLEKIVSEIQDHHSSMVHQTDCLRHNEKISSIRGKLGNFMQSTEMEIIIILVIILSCITLVLNDPIAAPDTELAITLFKIDLSCTLVFCVEAMIKITAHGFILGPDTYLRKDAWNKLDFFIVATSLVSLLSSSSSLRDLKTLRVVRVLRPLRFINKFKGLKRALQSLWLAIPSLGMVMVLGSLGWLVFAILGVQLFSGTFNSCTRVEWGDMSAEPYNIRFKSDCIGANATNQYGQLEWKANDANFDNILHAFLTLFEMSSLEGWVDIMYLGMDSVSSKEAPQKDHRPEVSLYFVSFILLGAFFVINLFVSALVDAFQEQGMMVLNEKRERKRSNVNTDEEEEKDPGWEAIQKVLMRHVKTPIRTNDDLSGFKLRCAQVVTHKYFEHAINIAVIANIAILSAEHYQEPDSWSIVSEVLNDLFVVLFSIEALLKTKAYTIRGYLSVPVNRFDFVVVIVSVAGIISRYASQGSSIGGAVSVFRALRLLRLLRLIHSAKGVSSLIRTLFLTLPTMVNVAGVMLLIFFVYAILGVNLFAKVKEGENLRGRATFHNFGSAILILVRISTGEAWPGLMHDSAVQPPECNENTGECGDPLVSYAYFVSFIIIETYVILNLFIAVLLDKFNDVVADEVMAQHLTDEETDKFFTTWRDFDPLQSCLIKVTDIPAFIRKIGPPLGPIYQDCSDYYIIKHYLASMQHARTVNGKLTQEKLLAHLCLLSFERTTGRTVGAKMREDFEKELAKAYYHGKNTEPEEAKGEVQTLRDNNIIMHHTAMMVQAVWRGRLARARLRLQQRKMEEKMRATPSTESESIIEVEEKVHHHNPDDVFNVLYTNEPELEISEEDRLLYGPTEPDVPLFSRYASGHTEARYEKTNPLVLSEPPKKAAPQTSGFKYKLTQSGNHPVSPPERKWKPQSPLRPLPQESLDALRKFDTFIDLDKVPGYKVPGFKRHVAPPAVPPPVPPPVPPSVPPPAPPPVPRTQPVLQINKKRHRHYKPKHLKPTVPMTLTDKELDDIL
eukprot:TRINITY_DN11124_c0_g1_i1.p1 TRINITY_DN11124_c0_g1~~TRINITY_DN11124_c0_g1_i1.p1  ORF type:complete len:1834 (+),score=281.60 TRINITY_DN11124_c0_g1_i1:78-5579(+)